MPLIYDGKLTLLLFVVRKSRESHKVKLESHDIAVLDLPVSIDSVLDI